MMSAQCWGSTAPFNVAPDVSHVGGKNMKRYKKLALAALIVGALSFGQASAAVQVNPIPGLPADFIKGADISVLQANINDISQRYDKTSSSSSATTMTRTSPSSGAMRRITDSRKGAAARGDSLRYRFWYRRRIHTCGSPLLSLAGRARCLVSAARRQSVRW